VLVVAAVLVLLVVLRPSSDGGPRLEPWHLVAPASEFDADRMPEGFDFTEFLRLEQEVFDELEQLLADEVKASPELATSRYQPAGANNPATFPTNWNRSFVLEPLEARGATVLIHGLTDSPYSLRAIGTTLAERGLAVIGLRLPGHGTVPEALDRVEREDWAAAVRLAIRRANELRGDGPLAVIGYSTGAALGLEYALDSIEDDALPRLDRLVMISPAIGVTRFAVLAGLPRLQRYVPFVGRLRWTAVEPEFDPFKYNSFAANGGFLTHRLTVSNRRRIQELVRDGRAADMPPVLAFMSLADATVRVESVAADLFEPLADPRSELVIFDVNRDASISAFLRFDPADRLAWLADRAPLAWTLSVVTNAASDTLDVVERRWRPEATEPVSHPIGLSWPAGVFSLSHVAVPFPIDDPINGYASARESWGPALGRLEPRGERGLLSLDHEFLMRLRSNPFYPYLEDRILGALAADDPATEH
jgi:alpha-beta hydrolase superfamily lysophospholipase